MGLLMCRPLSLALGHCSPMGLLVCRPLSLAPGSLGVLATATVSVSGRRKEGGITNVIPPTRRFGSSRVDPGAQKNTARADAAR